MTKEAKAWANKKSGKAPKPAKRPSQSTTTLAGAAAAAIAAVCFGVSRFTITNPVSTMEQPPPIERKPPVERKPRVEKPREEKPRPRPGGREDPGEVPGGRPAAPTPDPKCADKAPECGHWASIGECVANPGFMMVSCASSCDMCDMQDYRKRSNPNPNPNPNPNLNPNPNPNPNQDYRKRCAVDATVPLSVAPGAMDETFRHASSPHPNPNPNPNPNTNLGPYRDPSLSPSPNPDPNQAREQRGLRLARADRALLRPVGAAVRRFPQ